MISSLPLFVALRGDQSVSENAVQRRSVKRLEAFSSDGDAGKERDEAEIGCRLGGWRVLFGPV